MTEPPDCKHIDSECLSLEVGVRGASFISGMWQGVITSKIIDP